MEFWVNNMSLGTLRIKNCSDNLMWYKNSIGKDYEILRIFSDSYLVLADDGYTNIVLKKDSYEPDVIYEIVKCSCPILWYDDYINTFFRKDNIIFETDKAYWLDSNWSEMNNAWVYKEDVEVKY